MLTHINRTAVNTKSWILDMKTLINAVDIHFNRHTYNLISGCKDSFNVLSKCGLLDSGEKKVEFDVFIKENSPNITGMNKIFPKLYLYEIDQSIFQIDNYDLFCSPMGQGRRVLIIVKSVLFASSVTFETNFQCGARFS